MFVQRVLPPAARRESWTVLGNDGPVAPIERYLAYLGPGLWPGCLATP
jgi:integrase/recombinase XerD